MKTLRSHVCGDWYTAEKGFAPLIDPSTEEEIARASSAGIDFGAVLDHARNVGGPALRALSFGERGALLKAISGAWREHRDELLDLSRRVNGSTAPDGSFDVDGAGGTMAYYAFLSKSLGDGPLLAEGDGVQLAKTEAFWAQHVMVPKTGAAVHINAFNFPAWGFAEKAACALLAGMPVITKPATATALLTERMVEIVVDAGILPDGALQLICGGTGDLLDRLGAQDVLAFTGSADTALRLRDRDNLRRENTRFNIEADSLNAAVLGGHVAADSPTFQLFIKDVAREITQKAGQKCTAVRRVLVPSERMEEVEKALAARLARTVVGDPADDSVRMGPLATAAQLRDAERGVEELSAVAKIVLGTGKRVDGVGAAPGKGYFFGPTLLRVEDSRAAAVVHEREVFAPVATLLPYDGSAKDAAEIVALAGGTLVNSVYVEPTADGAADAYLDYIARVAPTTGRIYIGTAASGEVAPGSGAALPQALHGGPGRAGGGEELGGLVGLKLYMQRVALQGERGLIDGMV